MTSLFLGIVLSLLPRRYRERLPVGAQADLRQGAILSGVVEGALCLALFIVRYLDFLEYRVGDLGGRAIEKGVEGVLVNRVVHFGMGAVSLFEYLLHPLTVVLIYFAVEGFVRIFAAVITEEIVGTLPLCGVAWVEEQLGEAHAERSLGPRVADIVEEMYSPDYDLRIFTCRPKPRWDRMMTVAWQQKFYEIVGEQEGRPPHRFIYRLRKSPPGRVIRTVHHYEPQEVMWQKPPQPGFLSVLSEWAQSRLAELRGKGVAGPPVPDIVEPLMGADYHLRIASCRPKPTWDRLMTVEYEGQFYEVAGEETGTPAYPFVYLLRRLPPGKIIRTVHRYHSDEPLGEP